ncbi:MAG: hypothetical protein CM15mP120_09410 [Pseudomonadota bacterium]|nr:MAG: hypothetical protein CM15mP120_09410 [Pseudomonadota bacterium]
MDTRSSLPVPRNQHSVAVINERIYIIGGQFNHDSQQLDQARVDIYDPVSDTWSEGLHCLWRTPILRAQLLFTKIAYGWLAGTVPLKGERKGFVLMW